MAQLPRRVAFPSMAIDESLQLRDLGRCARTPSLAYAAVGKGGGGISTILTFALMRSSGIFRQVRWIASLSESPPRSLSLPGFCFIQDCENVPFVFTSRLWPYAVRDNLGSVGRELHEFVARWSRWSYRKSDYVGAVTEGILSELKSRRWPQSNCFSCPMEWISTILSPPPDDDSGWN